MGADHSTASFTALADLASARVGGRAVATNDDFFASKANLVKAEPPIFIPGKFTSRGKWMDGWESRRRRTPGHDWCIVAARPARRRPWRERGHAFLHRQLSVALLDRGGSILEGRRGQSRQSAYAETSNRPDPFVEILPKSALRGDGDNYLRDRRSAAVDAPAAQHLSRRRGCAAARRSARRRSTGTRVARRGRSIDLASILNGGLVLGRERHALRRARQPDHAGPRQEHGRRLGDAATPRARTTTGRSSGWARPDESRASRSTRITSKATTRTARRSRGRWRRTRR